MAFGVIVQAIEKEKTKKAHFGLFFNTRKSEMISGVGRRGRRELSMCNLSIVSVVENVSF